MEHMDLGVPKMSKRDLSILVVCLGNICRSPALEIALKKALVEHHLKHIHVESRGLSEKQRGKPIDEKVAKELESRGYQVPHDKSSLPISEEDFLKFDYILAADEKVLAQLQAKKPKEARSTIVLASHWSNCQEKEIPDPYKAPEEITAKSVKLAQMYAQDISTFLSSI